MILLHCLIQQKLAAVNCGNVWKHFVTPQLINQVTCWNTRVIFADVTQMRSNTNMHARFLKCFCNLRLNATVVGSGKSFTWREVSLVFTRITALLLRLQGQPVNRIRSGLIHSDPVFVPSFEERIKPKHRELQHKTKLSIWEDEKTRPWSVKSYSKVAGNEPSPEETRVPALMTKFDLSEKKWKRRAISAW